MRITKRKLKQIIREEYSRLKRHGLLSESYSTRRSAQFYDRQRLKALIRETIDEADLEEADLDEKGGFYKKLDINDDGEDDIEIGFTAVPSKSKDMR